MSSNFWLIFTQKKVSIVLVNTRIMPLATTTIERAKNEVKKVLGRYRVTWDDVAPDRDESIWQEARPVAKKVRKSIFQKTYPSLRRT